MGSDLVMVSTDGVLLHPTKDARLGPAFDLGLGSVVPEVLRCFDAER